MCCRMEPLGWFGSGTIGSTGELGCVVPALTFPPDPFQTHDLTDFALWNSNKNSCTLKVGISPNMDYSDNQKLGLKRRRMQSWLVHDVFLANMSRRTRWAK